MAVIFLTLSKWCFPINSVFKNALTISLAVSIPITLSPKQITLESLCSLVSLADKGSEHAELYVGDGKLAAAPSIERSMVHPYYDFGADYVLRYKGSV